MCDYFDRHPEEDPPRLLLPARRKRARLQGFPSQHRSQTHTQAQVYSGSEFSTSTLSTLLRAARRLTSGVHRTSAVAAVSASGLETRVAKTQIRTMSGITIDTINPAVKDMQYAVRGAIVAKAGEIGAELKKDPSKYAFYKSVMCNIGNPQSLGQKPITFYRQVLALCDFPDMLDSKEAETLFPADVRKRARDILANTKGGTGAYSESKGVAFLREMVAAGIEKRDGHPKPRA